MIHATGTYPTSFTCEVTIVLFIRQLFNKKIKKHIAGAKNILTLRHARTLAQEAENKLKMAEGVNDDDPLGMQINAFPHSEVLALQEQSGQPGNMQNMNQIQDVTVPRLNWKANCMS